MRLPSLNGLRAFEAAARHASFVRAAEELHVTAGAVSRHVRLLEAEMGVPLFRRAASGVALTPRGAALAPELTAALERIARATRQVARSQQEIRVGCVPTLASRWLLRRLAGFHAIWPEIRVVLGLIQDYATHHRAGLDLYVIDHPMELMRPAGPESVLLRREAMTPVCAPSLLPLELPEGLLRHRLLHPGADREDWRGWLTAAGLSEQVLLETSDLLQTLEMAIAGAIGGLGIAMADLHLVRGELATGVLVAPFPLVVEDQTGYFLVGERGRMAEPGLGLFRDWLLAELAAEA